MGQRDDRDRAGRFRPGTSGNPKGRPRLSAMAKLLAAAEAAGAEVVIRLPARTAEPEAPDAEREPLRCTAAGT